MPPHRPAQSLTPSPLELFGLDDRCPKPAVDGLLLLAEQATEKLPEPVAPVRAIVSQHPASAVDLDLPNGVPIIPDLDVADALVPIGRKRVVAQAPSTLLEVPHRGHLSAADQFSVPRGLTPTAGGGQLSNGRYDAHAFPESQDIDHARRLRSQAARELILITSRAGD